MENKMTLEQTIDEWLKFKKIVLKESTYYRYIYMINQYILPYFKDTEMDELQNFDFNLFVIHLMEKLRPTSIKNVISLFKSILYYSTKKYGYNFNFDFVVIPKVHKKELRVLTPKEKNKLEKYCLKNNTLKHLGIIICLNTGLRIGEICALKWDCIDLERRVLKIRYTMQRIYNKIEKNSMIKIDIPKSETSVRTIPISTKLYNILKPLKKQYSSNCFFLTGSSNDFIEPRTYQRMFEKCMRDCKIKDLHFHRPTP
ncbi:MAG: site-specific integrase [Clostridia bacterium]|nr:site-specific integrase [Clostridia bacterium]